MSRIATATALALVLSATAASAEGGGFEFTVENDTGAAITVYANDRSKCDLAPGGSCQVRVATMDVNFSYAKADGARVAFSPGNLEMVDVCKLNAVGGVHCVDPMGR